MVLGIGQPTLLSVRSNTSSQNAADEIRRHVEYLAAIEPPRSHAHMASLEKAVQYIRHELRTVTREIRIEEFDVKGRKYKNVVANLGPKGSPLIIIGAHYDVCGDQPGADDNASGVAGLLMLTKLLAANTALTQRYELVFYSLEEPPHFRTEYMGSAVHAANLKANGMPVRYMISLETIGFFSDKKGSQEYPFPLGVFYPSTGNFIAMVGRSADATLIDYLKGGFMKGTDLKLISLAAPSFVTGVDFSDHLNYWKQGWPAVMITDTAFMRNHNYHELGDTPDTLDYVKIVEVVRGVHRAVTN